MSKQKRARAVHKPPDVSKSLAEFRARGRENSKIVFGGGMYVAENTSRGASVELSVIDGQPRRRAQRRCPSSEGRGTLLRKKAVETFFCIKKRACAVHKPPLVSYQPFCGTAVISSEQSP